MPNGLPMYEQCYYISSRGLYDQYQKGSITLEQAKREKQEVIKAYEIGRDQWQLFIGLYDISDALKRLKQEGFDTVLEFEILDKIEAILK